MIFYILLAVLVVFMIGVIWNEVKDPWGGWGTGLLFGLVFTPLVGVGIILVVLGITQAFLPYNLAGQSDQQLRALGTGQDIDGRSYFLGSGYIDQEQVFTYVEQDGDAYRLKQADADDSVVYMDEEDKPYVTTYEWGREAWWLAPFVFSHSHTYDFHIPEGSIANSYEVKP